MEWTKERMEELLTEIRDRSLTDEAFRKRLLEDPNTVLEETAGMSLPEGYTLKVVENDPTFMLTMSLADPVMTEFSEEDLDEVDGGISIIINFAGACAAALSVGGCFAHACSADYCLADLACGANACAGKGKTI